VKSFSFGVIRSFGFCVIIEANFLELKPSCKRKSCVDCQFSGGKLLSSGVACSISLISPNLPAIGNFDKLSTYNTSVNAFCYFWASCRSTLLTKLLLTVVAKRRFKKFDLAKLKAMVSLIIIFISILLNPFVYTGIRG
jgi:hypothetical protein